MKRAEPASPRAARQPYPSADPLANVVVVLIGVAFGSSAFLGFGFYNLPAWGSIGLVLVALALGIWIARPWLPRGVGMAAVGGLLLLWVWSLISTRWAESAEAALVDANRWLVYAAVLLVLLPLLRGRRGERLLLAAALVPLLALDGYLISRMAIGHGAALFLGNRLDSPVAYVNGLAGFLLVGFWPMIAVAERAASKVWAGAGLAAAIVIAGLTVLTQSRGAIAALALSAILLLALIPGRVRRGWALVAVAAGILVCSGPLGDVIGTPASEVPTDGSIASAARAIVGVAVIAGALWGLSGLAADRLPSRLTSGPRSLPAAGLAFGVAIGVVALAATASTRIDQVKTQYEAFTSLQPLGTGSRLAAGGGNRYDYWRVALNQFEDAPVKGVGAGNYDTTYFRERRTTESIHNPHSIELQALGETGIVGGAGVVLFAAGALGGLWLRARPKRAEFDAGLAVAAGGCFLVWLGQTSVDWLHLIPGLTGVALCAVAVLVAPTARKLDLTKVRRRTITGVLGGSAAVAALLIAIPVVSDLLVSSGRDRLESDPSAAVARAQHALSVDDESLAAYQLEAAGFARLGDYGRSRGALLAAADREPSDFVNWALLGDLATRRGDLRAAQSFYARAAALNPLDPGLHRLSSSRRSIRELAQSSAGGRR